MVNKLTRPSSTGSAYVVSRERPIFIVGAARSGTTLLRFMLSQHPHIYIPPQSGFIPQLFGKRPREPMSWQEATRNFNRIFKSRPFIKHWLAEYPHVEDFLAGLPDLTPASFLDAIYSKYAKQHGAIRWGDKTPIYTGYIDLIVKIFPDAQFIHIIRDGRDVAMSILKTYQSLFYVDIYYATLTWKNYVRKGLASAVKLNPNQYFEVQYEQLTSMPEEQLRKICDFLNEEYFPAMLHPEELARRTVSAKNIHAATRKPVTKKKVGKWKHTMLPRDLRLFQAVAGDLLEELGYSSFDAGILSFLEKIRLIALKAKYSILEGGRRILQPLGFFNPH